MFRTPLVLVVSLLLAGTANAQCYRVCQTNTPTNAPFMAEDNHISASVAFARPSIASIELDDLMTGFALKASHHRDIYLSGELVWTTTNLLSNRSVLAAQGYYLNDTQALDWSGRIGKPFRVSADLQLTPYASVGGRQLGDTDVTLSHTFAGAGLLSQFRVAPRDSILSLDASYAHMVKAKIDASPYGEASFEEQGIVRVNVEYTVPVADRYSIVVGANWQGYDYGAEDVTVPLEEWRMYVGGGWRF